MIAFVLNAAHMAALELAEADNLFRAPPFGWRGRNTHTVRHTTVRRLRELGLVMMEYRQRQAVEACLATVDGKLVLAIARRDRSSRPRPVIQHTEKIV